VSLFMAILSVFALGMAGCSGDSKSTSASAPATYNFSVMATSGSAQKATPYTLTVQ
jgi:hypothetical protein